MRLALVLTLAACSVADTAQLPPPAPGTLTLDVDALVPGASAIHTVSGAQPNALVYLGASVRAPQPGPCLGAAGGLCLDIASPMLLGTVRANGAGEASFLLGTPNTLSSGTSVTLQAVAIQGPGGRDSASSPPVQALIDGDADGDGFPASVDCDDDDWSVRPGATERCNGIDDDCDPSTSEEGRVTVNGTAFNSLLDAINAAPTGGEIELCGGDHRLSGVQLQREVHFVGIGPDRARIRPQAGGRILLATADFSATHVQFDSGDPNQNIIEHAVVFQCDGGCFDYVLDDVVFTGNEAGALWAQTSTLQITDSEFRDNHGGGALMLGFGTMVLDNVSIVDNSNAVGWGGGIDASGGDITIRNSEVLRNDAVRGGGAFVDNAMLTSQWTDWGFGPATDNTPEDVLVDGTLTYGAFGNNANFVCHGSWSTGTVGCQ
jgi:hypothetical protein